MYQGLNGNIPTSIVVFFVAIPLCLDIALASEAPLLWGIISGLIDVIVSLASGSYLGISGPALVLAVTKKISPLKR